MSESIELWSERGVPRSEIVKRIRERDMKDCITAQQWLLGSLPDETMGHMCKMADGLRSTARVLSFLDLEALKAHADKEASVESIVEIVALAIEAYVRAADECFPVQGRN